MQNNMYRNNLNDYNQNRRSIKTKDEDSWFYKKIENGFPTALETENEEVLEAKMSNIRQKYIDNCLKFGIEYPASEPFYKVKPDIEKCPLFTKVFRNMPKGGLLHIHSAAALSVSNLFLLLKIWNMEYKDDIKGRKVYVVNTQNSSQQKYAKGTLLYGSIVYNAANLNLDKYVTPFEEINGDSIKRRWLRDLLTFGGDRIEEIPYVWDEFNTIFARTANLFEDSDFYLRYHYHVFCELISDNIPYVELRCGFQEFNNVNSILLRTDYDYRYHDYYIEMMGFNNDESDYQFLDLLKRALYMANEGRDVPTKLELRVILCARRSLSPETDEGKIFDKLNRAIIAKNRYPDLVIGFDFVSEEDRGYSTSSYSNIIYYNPGGQFIPPIGEIDFYLHDGESNWFFNENIIDASIISKYRIGHGISMNKNPGVTNLINYEVAPQGLVPYATPKEPVLEICPISNQLLKYFPDLRNHSAYELMKRGIQCVIANDDPQIFDNPGVSYDFWMAYVGFGLNLIAIKRLVYNSYYFYWKNCKSGQQTFGDFSLNVGVIWNEFVGRALVLLELENI